MKLPTKPEKTAAALCRPSRAVWGLIALVSTLFVPDRVCAEKDGRPNIIFILTDDQRADSLGCMGNPVVKTPNLDRLAEDGTLFVNATVTSTLCTPSRASFFTGQFERTHGINFNSGTAMSKEAWGATYPMLLQKAGYFVAYIGKNHVPVGSEGYATGWMDESFDYWYAGHEHLTFYPKERPAFALKIPGIDERMFDNAKADTQTEVLEEGVENFLQPGEDFVEKAARALKMRPRDRPFCLSLAFNLPHDAATSSMQDRVGDLELYRTGYHELRSDLRAALPATYLEAANIKEPKLPPDLLRVGRRQASYDYVNTPEAAVERIIRWYQTITGIDAMVGRLRAELAKLSLADNTIIVFSSDHGIMSGEFGLGGKALLYDPCLRVPLIVYDPRVPSGARGQRREELVQSIDVAPTILDFASVEIPAAMQGKTMVPLVRGDNIPWRKYAFGENFWSTDFGNPRCDSVRSLQWKYIRYFPNEASLFDDVADLPDSLRIKVSHRQAARYREWLSAPVRGEKPVYEELFDLSNDPDEVVNVAGDERFHEELEKYRMICDQLAKEAMGDGPPETIELQGERLEFHLQKIKPE
jgi:arylsulfatase A-like enzyme